MSSWDDMHVFVWFSIHLLCSPKSCRAHEFTAVSNRYPPLVGVLNRLVSLNPLSQQLTNNGETHLVVETPPVLVAVLLLRECIHQNRKRACASQRVLIKEALNHETLGAARPSPLAVLS